MHKKHAKDGLAVISVCTDALENDDNKADTLKFLRAKEAHFTNLALDETADLWQEKLRFSAPPCYYVFSRQGKWTQFEPVDDGIDHHAVEKLVVELLREK